MKQPTLYYFKHQLDLLLFNIKSGWLYFRSLADSAKPKPFVPAKEEEQMGALEESDPQVSMFVVEKIFDLEDGYVCQSVFVASELDKATEYIESRDEEEQERYRIVQHNVDVWPEDDNQIVPPDVMRQLIEDQVSEELQEMSKKGLVDQLVGEDGHFYFELTDKGREAMENAREEKSEKSEENEEEKPDLS